MKEQLFLGVKLTPRLERELADCPLMYQSYFKDNNPDYLVTTIIGQEKYLGKVLAQGTDLEALRDIVRNIRSILGKICPRVRFDDGQLRLYAQILIS